MEESVTGRFLIIIHINEDICKKTRELRFTVALTQHGRLLHHVKQNPVKAEGPSTVCIDVLLHLGAEKRQQKALTTGDRRVKHSASKCHPGGSLETVGRPWQPISRGGGGGGWETDSTSLKH